MRPYRAHLVRWIRLEYTERILVTIPDKNMLHCQVLKLKETIKFAWSFIAKEMDTRISGPVPKFIILIK